MVESTVSETREKQMTELFARGEGYMKEMKATASGDKNGFSVVHESGEGDRKNMLWAKNTPKDGTITGTQYFAEGITKDMWEWWIDVDRMPGLIAKLDKNLKGVRTADVDGCSTFWMWIRFP